MQQGIHLGKIVVSMHNESHIPMKDVVRQKKITRFDSAGAYLLVGGLGGLGRSVSTWMVEHGARHLIYLSRNAGASKEHLEFSQELASMGCRVDFVRGTVLNIDDVSKAMKQANGHLKGVFQMSMVLRDAGFPQMTKSDWDTAVSPKVKGTWNLHNASISINASLDFFLLFSSLSGIVGNPGQTNYAGANTFMDAFAQYRFSLGLPACTIQLGIVEDVGYAAQNESVMPRLTNTFGSGSTVSEQELLGTVEAAVHSGSHCLYLGVNPNMFLENPDERSLWKSDVRFSAFHLGKEVTDTSASSSSNDLQTFLSRAKTDAALLSHTDSAHFLALEIGKKVFNFLLKPEEHLQTSCTLAELGLDSLVAIEVRQWWKRAFGFDISVLELMGMGTLDDLGVHAAKGMLCLFHGVEA